MKILADQHISPRTVEFLTSLGHDAVRVSERLPGNSPDSAIVLLAAAEGRVVLTHDLDFTALIATSGRNEPSLLVLRLRSLRVEHVNEILRRVLPIAGEAVSSGAIISVDEERVRIRRLPIQ